MARVNFSLRIGRRGPQFEARTQAFMGKLDQSTMATFERRAAEMIGVGAGRLAGVKVEHKLEVVIPRVQQEIKADLERYARSALKFFFSRKSSTSKQDLVINLTELMGSSSGFSSNFAITGNTTNKVLTWAPLAKSTIETKRNRGDPNPTTYFVGSGQLKADMQTQLPKFFERVLNPGIRVTFRKEYSKDSALKDKMVPIADIEVVVATQNKAGLAGVAFMRGQLTTPGPMKSTLLRNYLEEQIDVLADDIIVKLENRGSRKSRVKNPRRQRPWVEAAMSFWVLNRLPLVFQQSVKKHIKDQI